MACAQARIVVVLVVLALTHCCECLTVAANIGGSTYWSQQGIYCDIVKQAEYPFGSPSAPYNHARMCNGSTPCTGNGWPLTDYGIWLWEMQSSLDAGMYPITAIGNATVTTWQFGEILNQHYDPATNKWTGLINVTLDADTSPTNSKILDLRVTNVSSTGFVNVSIRNPECGADDIFHPKYIQLLQKFNGPLRAMSMLGATDSGQTDWSTRASIDSATWGVDASIPCSLTKYGVSCDREVPWELVINLANVLQRDVWINIPPNATDAYIHSLAMLLKSEITPTSIIYIEYANEVWNWMFPVADWNINEAKIAVKNGDPAHFNYDNCSNPGYWAWRRVAWKLKGVLDVFADVYGEDARNKQFRGVYASQIGAGEGSTGFSGGPASTALNYINDVYGNPGNYFYALAGAPYYGLGDPTHWANLTEAMVLNISSSVINSMIPTATNNYTQTPVVAFSALASWFSLKFVGYEGGPDYSGNLVDPGANRSIAQGNINAKMFARESPQQTVLVKTYLEGLAQAGMEFLEWFGAFIGSYNSTITYSCIQELHDDLTKSAILAGISQAIETPTLPITGGINLQQNAIWGYDELSNTLGYQISGPCTICDLGTNLSINCLRCLKPGTKLYYAVNSGSNGDNILSLEGSSQVSVSLNASTDGTLSVRLWLNNEPSSTVNVANTTIPNTHMVFKTVPLTTITLDNSALSTMALEIVNATSANFALAGISFAMQ
eukprot:m.343321 g.343321  ORF g.343321 m.343321 type:complete len:722 (-) comp22693_c0_seq1:162-2327(-)